MSHETRFGRAGGALKPSRLLLMMEGRAVYDAAGMLSLRPFRRFLPRGDDHPVLVLPGFLASSRSTRPLRQFIQDLGYRAHRWKLGYNMGYSHRLHYGMRERVTELVNRYDRKISLIGWSLGGVYARELAREMPDIVRQVITMGSPFRGSPQASNVERIFHLFAATPFEEIPQAFLESMEVPPPVPTTALYTRSDGVVAWQSTVEVSGREDVENIHVGGAHMGLGFNPRALIAIADRLALAEGAWRPFRPPLALAPLYRNWYPEWLVKGDPVPRAPRGR